MPLYEFTPHDVLFFRDARPMESNVGSGGHGANWPSPTVLFDALHAALWRAFPGQQPWEVRHSFGRSSARVRSSGKDLRRFGSLSTAGFFPCVDGTWFFPCPGDVVRTGDSTLVQLAPIPLGDPGCNNLPHPGLRPLGNPSKPSKETPLAWWSKSAIEGYLEGRCSGEMLPASALYSGEWTTGIARDDATGKQDDEHIYSAESMRLCDGVSLGGVATLPVGSGREEKIRELLPASGRISVGGQSRVCSVNHVESTTLQDKLPLGLLPEKLGTRLKWVLLSPAIWTTIEPGTDSAGQLLIPHPGGWLPNWICPETLTVLLKCGATDRKGGEMREEWRKRVRGLPTFSARLVAARVGKPQPITGWSDEIAVDATSSRKGIKNLHLAVPAGSVFYFECSEAAEAVKLAAALNWHGASHDPDRVINRRSTLLGEKGFGLGVCGTWDEIPSKENQT